MQTGILIMQSCILYIKKFPNSNQKKTLMLENTPRHISTVVFLSFSSAGSQKSMEYSNEHFLTPWPWPLTYDLDLHTWPRYLTTWPPCSNSSLYVCPLGWDSETDRQTDRHTDSGDLSPTRTCVPYVLLALVWRHFLLHQFFIRMKNTCEPKNNCNSVTHSNICEPINQPCDPEFLKKYSLPCPPWCTLRLGGAYCGLMVHKAPIYHCSGA